MADTLAFESIGSLAAQIRQGAVSPVALTEDLLTRIDALDPHLHAFLALTRQRALGRHSLRGEGSVRRRRVTDDSRHARARRQRGRG